MKIELFVLPSVMRRDFMDAFVLSKEDFELLYPACREESEAMGGDFDGLILLGSYSTADLSGSGLTVLSVYGSEDGVMNREKYDEYKSNLPEGFTEVIIEGGNHAYFGAYGEQEGDGTATVTPAEQLRQTAEAILSMPEVSHEN